MLKKFLDIPVFCLLSALFLTGCAGYKIGSPSPAVPPGSRIAVLPVLNKTVQPQLTEPVTITLRRTIQQDGTFLLSTTTEADYVLSTELLKYERRAISYNPTDVIGGQDYELLLTAQVKLQRAGTDKVVWTQTIVGTTMIRAGEDFVASENRGIYTLAADLAQRIVKSLTEGTW